MVHNGQDCYVPAGLAGNGAEDQEHQVEADIGKRSRLHSSREAQLANVKVILTFQVPPSRISASVEFSIS